MEEWLANNYPTVLIIVAGGGLVFGIGKWVGTVNSERGAFKTFMEEVRADIKKILDRVPAPTVTGKSPVTLTDFGENISERLRVKDWADHHAPNMVERSRGKEEFEIFELCVGYVDEKIKESQDFAKNMRAGAYQIGTELDNVRKVYEVELRDAVLRLLGLNAP